MSATTIPAEGDVHVLRKSNSCSTNMTFKVSQVAEHLINILGEEPLTSVYLKTKDSRHNQFLPLCSIPDPNLDLK